MIRTNIHLALASLKSSKLRSLLTMFAVIIGVSSFVVVTATVDGLRNSTVTEINELGGNLVSVVSGDVLIEDEEGNESFNFLGASGDPTLTNEDIQIIQETDGVIAAAPLAQITGSVFRGETQMNEALIMATTDDYPKAFTHEVKDGTFFNDDAQSGRFAVLGTGIVDTLFAGDVALGSQIILKGESYTIIGVMEEVTSTIGELLGFSQNNVVYVSTESGEKLSGGPLKYAEIDLQIQEDRDPNEVITSLEEAILENHGGEEDFSVLQQDQLVGLIDSLLGTIKIAGQFLSFIMLFVASVVILLIMLITVRERTREIGIRKSIGATNNNILVQFLTEAIVISWVGSFIGLVIGFLLGLIVQNQADLTPQYSLNTILVLLVISTLVGIIAGVGPAWMAARRDPVESLRHE